MAAATLADARFTAEDRVLFVSDVHITYGDDDYLRRFLDFLDDVSTGGARALYIHGDLFDFYVGPRQGARPFYRPLFEALARLVKEGVAVGVIHGNRDFLMGRCFLEHGVVVLPDAVSITCGESRVHLSHGDQFCIHDRSYQFWARTVLRAAPLRFCVRNLPVAVAIWLARRYRGVSRRKFARHRRTHDTRLPTVLDGVHQLLRSDPHDVVICGHIHHLADTSLDVQGTPARLLTTGAWEQGPNHIEWSGGAFRLRGLEDPHPVARR